MCTQNSENRWNRQLRCCIPGPLQVVPAQRWDIEAYYAPDASRNLTMDVRLAAFVTGFDKFDAAAFRRAAIAQTLTKRNG